MVGVSGFEPPTPASRRRCSTKLSYTPTDDARETARPLTRAPLIASGAGGRQATRRRGAYARLGVPPLYSAGRRSAHGRACSKARAACSTVRSAKRLPTTCSPTGSPASVKPQGTEAAGLWLKLKG